MSGRSISSASNAAGRNTAGTGAAAGRRVALKVAYLGTRYAGWQRQPNAVTVQAKLEEALTRLLGEPVVVIGASRTDAGVHALAQHVHFTLPRSFPLSGLVLGGNSELPEDIRVMSAHEVSAEFHAQRSARCKRYRYSLSLTRVVDPLRAAFVASMDRRLHLATMQAAVAVLVGRHDFSAFAKAGGSHDDPVREIFKATVEQRGKELVLEFWGNGFLRGMVRAMVGTLVEAGLGRRTPRSIAGLLRPGRNRSEAGVAAPAKGLVLVEIEYPPEFFESCDQGRMFDGEAIGI